MKLVGYLNAACAWREIVEEYSPLTGALSREIIEVVKETFSFDIVPSAVTFETIGQPLVFGQGKYQHRDEAFAFGMLVMEPNGDVVQSVDTTQAEKVLDRLAEVLDERLGYRLTKIARTRSYVSNIVVEFDEPLEKYLDKLQLITDSINLVRGHAKNFALKRLAFGLPPVVTPADQVTTVEFSDFLIERRAGMPFEKNRYYCSAPLRTEDHVSILHRIEDILRN